ncbi:three-Cys-motif partner protein TcmP [Rhodocaloribacter sp.]
MARKFGGLWTREKLDILENYLKAYLTALKKQRFERWYIDAFAGDGSIRLAASGKKDLFEVRDLIHGSARRALSLNPGFERYLFIENDPSAAANLAKLREEYADKRIRVMEGDANDHLREICQKSDWTGRRAVLFLDPAGMQVSWETMEAVAATRAIDVWIWFPLGVGVNRLLVRSGEINPAWEERLDRVFGTKDWRTTFYKETHDLTLFGKEEHRVKTATPQAIADYYNERLASIFPAVASNPRMMRNARKSPLYLLCFAAANPKGASIALRIAQHLLK